MSDDDDLFASLGGSLMRDLLADLQGNDEDDLNGGGDWLNLEQLEQELNNLGGEDLGLPMVPEVPEQPTTAANLVVNQQQQLSTPTISAPAQDAWSLSLEKFTASSLESDFLKADSARKEQQQKQMSVPSAPPGLDLSKAEDYNVTEAPRVSRPPGIPEDSNQQMLTQAAQKLQEVQLAQAASSQPPMPPRNRVPRTPRNSVDLTGIQRPPPATPQNSISLPGTNIKAPTPPPSIQSTPVPNKVPMNPNGSMIMSPVQLMPPLQGVPVSTPLAPAQQPPYPQPPMPSPMMPSQGMTPMQTPVMAVPVRQTGPAWSNTPQPVVPQQHTPVIYCNPHPRAPPIPAGRLESKYMKARDISYVVHGIMKPVLQAGISEFDYDIQLLKRRDQSANPGNTKSPGKEAVAEEYESRQKKTKTWSKDQNVLGHVGKTNVARPKALIAQPVTAEGSSKIDEKENQGSNKERASLWKARIYCDQAYQALSRVLEILQESKGKSVPPTLQQHLIKLMKCLGVTFRDGHYRSDISAMELLLKLSKGRVLLSRVFEQALLPTKAVHCVLPSVLHVLYGMNGSDDDRVFVALASVIRNIPDLPLAVLLKGINECQSSGGEVVLKTASRMQMVHALLARGGSSHEPDEAVKNEWKAAESKFMEILTGM